MANKDLTVEQINQRLIDAAIILMAAELELSEALRAVHGTPDACLDKKKAIFVPLFDEVSKHIQEKIDVGEDPTARACNATAAILAESELKIQKLERFIANISSKKSNVN